MGPLSYYLLTRTLLPSVRRLFGVLKGTSLRFLRILVGFRLLDGLVLHVFQASIPLLALLARILVLALLQGSAMFVVRHLLLVSICAIRLKGMRVLPYGLIF